MVIKAPEARQSVAPAVRTCERISAAGAIEGSPGREAGDKIDAKVEPRRGERFVAPDSYAPPGLYKRCVVYPGLTAGATL